MEFHDTNVQIEEKNALHVEWEVSDIIEHFMGVTKSNKSSFYAMEIDPTRVWMKWCNRLGIATFHQYFGHVEYQWNIFKYKKSREECD